MSTDDHKRIVERFDALLGSDDISDLDQLRTPDGVNPFWHRTGLPDSLARESSWRQSDGRALWTIAGTS